MAVRRIRMAKMYLIIPLVLVAWEGALQAACSTSLTCNKEPGDMAHSEVSVMSRSADALDDLPTFGPNAANFTIVKKSVKFFEALSICAKAGGHLADITSVQEKDELVALAKQEIPRYGYGLFVSGMPAGKRGLPVWITTGKSIPKNIWKRNGMDTKNCTSTCTLLGWRGSNTGVNFSSCVDTHYFICRRGRA